MNPHRTDSATTATTANTLDATLVHCLDRHRHWAAMTAVLDEALATHHGLGWSDFVLLNALADHDAGLPTAALASRLHLGRSRLVAQLLPLEKTGLIARQPAARSVALRAAGRRMVREARATVAACEAPLAALA